VPRISRELLSAYAGSGDVDRKTNERIVGIQDGQVVFQMRDTANAGKKRVEKLPAEAFIGRFLLHAWPGRFKRIRHYGRLPSFRPDAK
jgi:hypothetical protein